MKVKFLDLNRQHLSLGKNLECSFANSLKMSDFILGEDVSLFEKEFAGYCGTKFAVGVNSGTDALFLSLKSFDIGPGDEVILPAFTFIATALAVSYSGAKPVFADINLKNYNIDPECIKKAVTSRTKAIIPVHLYGQPADMQPILEIGAKYNLKVIEDACQAHGARYSFACGEQKKVGNIGDTGAFSFYPTKNLGACGDAGLITTNNENIYKKLLILRDCGRKLRYEHAVIGYNSRLDTLQAAILRKKLKLLDSWNRKRRKLARMYTQALQDMSELTLPVQENYAFHVYNSYTVCANNRDRLCEELQKRGVGTSVYYHIPLHLQGAYKDLGYKRGDFKHAEKISQQVFSLPLYPYLSEAELKYVIKTLKACLKKEKNGK